MIHTIEQRAQPTVSSERPPRKTDPVHIGRDQDHRPTRSPVPGSQMGFNSLAENWETRSRPEPMRPGKQAGKRRHTCPGPYAHPYARTRIRIRPHTHEHPPVLFTSYMSDRKFFSHSFWGIVGAVWDIVGIPLTLYITSLIL